MLNPTGGFEHLAFRLGVKPPNHRTLLPKRYILVQTDLVLHGDRVPRHIDALDGTEGGESLSDGVLAQLVVYGAHVDTAHDGQRTLPLGRHLPGDHNTPTLPHQHTNTPQTKVYTRCRRQSYRFVFQVNVCVLPQCVLAPNNRI